MRCRRRWCLRRCAVMNPMLGSAATTIGDEWISGPWFIQLILKYNTTTATSVRERTTTPHCIRRRRVASHNPFCGQRIQWCWCAYTGAAGTMLACGMCMCLPRRPHPRRRRRLCLAIYVVRCQLLFMVLGSWGGERIWLECLDLRLGTRICATIRWSLGQRG